MCVSRVFTDHKPGAGTTDFAGRERLVRTRVSQERVNVDS